MLTRSRVLLILIVAATLTLGVFAGISIRATIQTYYAYAGYANAISDYLRKYDDYPESLEQLERAYLSSGYRSAQIPPIAPFPRPLYRPVAPGLDREYLIVVSPERLSNYTPYRLAIYASRKSRKANAQLLFSWTAESALKEDDERRQLDADSAAPH